MSEKQKEQKEREVDALIQDVNEEKYYKGLYFREQQQKIGQNEIIEQLTNEYEGLINAKGGQIGKLVLTKFLMLAAYTDDIQATIKTLKGSNQNFKFSYALGATVIIALTLIALWQSPELRLLFSQHTTDIIIIFAIIMIIVVVIFFMKRKG